MPSSHGPTCAPAVPMSKVAAIAPIRAGFRMPPRPPIRRFFTRSAHAAPRELGLDAFPKLATRALSVLIASEPGSSVLLDAFSSCEPVPTSLENAMLWHRKIRARSGIGNDLLLRNSGAGRSCHDRGYPHQCRPRQRLDLPQAPYLLKARRAHHGYCQRRESRDQPVGAVD